jgi:hypothetical protein
MGNLRGGGIIIIGVSQRDDTWQLDGISPEHLATFDVDNFTDQVNAYVSPYVDLTLVSVEYSSKKCFLAIAVGEFIDTPLVCKKNAPSPKDLAEGSIYIRSYGKPGTTRVMRAEQLHDLLELAGEKRARRIIEVSHRIGLVTGTSSIEYFAREIATLSETLSVPIVQNPYWQIIIRPESYESELIPSISACSQIIERIRVSLGGWSYPCQIFHPSLSARGSSWIAGWIDDSMTRREYWRMYQSGQFAHLLNLWNQSGAELKRINYYLQQFSSYGVEKTVSGYVSIPDIIFNMTGMYEFAARLCASNVYRGMVTFHVKLVGIRDFVLAQPKSWFGFNGFHQATENSLEHSISVSSADLVADSQGCAIKSVVWFAERFGWDDPPASAFSQSQQSLFE